MIAPQKFVGGYPAFSFQLDFVEHESSVLRSKRKQTAGGTRHAMRLLLVDDDPALRALVRATFDDVGVEVVEAESATVARQSMARARPDVIVLDVVMPRESGLEFCRELKDEPETAEIPVVLLSGAHRLDAHGRAAAGADASLPKPFSPLQLLAIVEQLAGGSAVMPLVEQLPREGTDAQLLMYARDLRQLLELERAQRRLLQAAYRETVAALADALATKDTGTRAHSQRVQRYALELARAVDPELAEDPSIEYGFLLHDVGKIGVPDSILVKPEPLPSDCYEPQPDSTWKPTTSSYLITLVQNDFHKFMTLGRPSM